MNPRTLNPTLGFPSFPYAYAIIYNPNRILIKKAPRIHRTLKEPTKEPYGSLEWSLILIHKVAT